MAKRQKLSDGSVWPLPDHDNEEGSTAWKLRYQRPVDQATVFHGAEIAEAYTYLLTCSVARRNQVIRELRAALRR